MSPHITTRKKNTKHFLKSYNDLTVWIKSEQLFPTGSHVTRFLNNEQYGRRPHESCSAMQRQSVSVPNFEDQAPVVAVGKKRRLESDTTCPICNLRVAHKGALKNHYKMCVLKTQAHKLVQEDTIAADDGTLSCSLCHQSNFHHLGALANHLKSCQERTEEERVKFASLAMKKYLSSQRKIKVRFTCAGMLGPFQGRLVTRTPVTAQGTKLLRGEKRSASHFFAPEECETQNTNETNRSPEVCNVVKVETADGAWKNSDSKDGWDFSEAPRKVQRSRFGGKQPRYLQQARAYEQESDSGENDALVEGSSFLGGDHGAPCDGQTAPVRGRTRVGHKVPRLTQPRAQSKANRALPSSDNRAPLDTDNRALLDTDNRAPFDTDNREQLDTDNREQLDDHSQQVGSNAGNSSNDGNGLGKLEDKTYLPFPKLIRGFSTGSYNYLQETLATVEQPTEKQGDQYFSGAETFASIDDWGEDQLLDIDPTIDGTGDYDPSTEDLAIWDQCFRTPRPQGEVLCNVLA